MLISIIIPTHNEALDIQRTLDAALAVRYHAKEILVIDDASTDNTVEIVMRYTTQGVRLIALERNRGVAAARNIGLKNTAAEIVVILNADVILPPDFLEQLLRHYQTDVDFVVVEAKAINMESVFARYVQAAQDRDYTSNPIQGNLDWSEGWSCRRAAALAVGGFPEEFPGASGEDAIFVQALLRQGYKRLYAPAIVVSHYVPEKLNAFWKQRLSRGRGAAYRRFGYEKVQPALWPMLKSWLGLMLWLLSGILPLLESVSLIKYSPRGWADLLGMYWAVILNALGQQVGYWHGYRQITQTP